MEQAYQTSSVPPGGCKFVQRLIDKLTKEEVECARKISTPLLYKNAWIRSRLGALGRIDYGSFLHSGRVAHTALVIGLRSEPQLSDLQQLFAACLLHETGQIDNPAYSISEKIIQHALGQTYGSAPRYTGHMSMILRAAHIYDNNMHLTYGDVSSTILSLAGAQIPSEYIDILR